MNGKQKKIPVYIVRAAVQLLFFILIPGSFIKIFSAVGSIYTSIINGSFVFSEQISNIILVSAAMLITFIWGRFFCGFICSFGAMQDLLWLGGKKLKFRPVISEKTDSVLKYFKYAVLLFVFFGVWTFGVTGSTVWSPWSVFGMYASPWKGFPAEALIISIGGALLLLTIIGSLLIERFFCKYVCPLGALYAMVSRFRIFRIKRNDAECSEKCRICTGKCPMSIPLYKCKEISSGECIDCLKCTAVCPKGNVKAETLPAVSGTLAAAALAGATFVGTLNPFVSSPSSDNTDVTAVSATDTTAKFKDGTYVGSAAGYRGITNVTVEVKNGLITKIEATSDGDDPEYFAATKQKIINSIITAQDVRVSTVSGATYSSIGIINAVADAIGAQLLELPGTTASSAYDATTEPTEQTTTASAAEQTTESGTASAAVTETTEAAISETETAKTTSPAATTKPGNVNKTTQPTQKEATTAQTEPEKPTTTQKETPTTTQKAIPTTTQKATTTTTQKATTTTTQKATTTTTQKETTTAAQSTGKYADGVYTGTGSGYRGNTVVSVTVKNGEITSITVTSYQDNEPYFGRAKSGVISAILNKQSIDVSTVSGATYSSNSIKEAVAKALGIEFTNPNGSGGKHRH